MLAVLPITLECKHVTCLMHNGVADGDCILQKLGSGAVRLTFLDNLAGIQTMESKATTVAPLAIR